MGAIEDRLDARADGNFKEAFEFSLIILNRKGSKRLMSTEIEECRKDLESLGKIDLLPANFGQHSVYGQREILNEIKLEE